MSHLYRFPIKGSYYYAADKAFTQQLLTVGNTLYLHPEPDNEHDGNALQIWTQPNAQGYLIGYVPRQLAKHWRTVLTEPVKTARHPPLQIPVRLSLSLAKGKRLRLECEIQLTVNWLKHLQIVSWAHWVRQQQALKWWLNTQHKHDHPR
ncbi:MAG: HIRAN domain-containing protein [Thiotrichales bacterium]|nr:HIRAN domain-containing protein [Thiotrichales bacterium]